MERLRLTKALDEALSHGTPTQAFLHELKECAELADFDGKWQSFGGSQVLVNLRQLANWMIRRAQIVDSRTVIEDLSRYLSANEIPFRKIMVLATAIVEKPLQLSCGTELVPLDHLPDSQWKNYVSERYGHSWLHYRPTAAVQHFTNYPRRHYEKPPKIPPNDAEFQVLEDVRLCMTCVGPGAPLGLGWWIQAEDWVPNLALSAMLPEPLNTGGYARHMSRDFGDLPDLHRLWISLDENARKHLRVPLGRINSARRNNNIVSAAIDLGIAIDSVFRTGRGYGPVRIRAARFLGEDEHHRKSLAETFSILWKMRCDAVHEGEIKSQPNPEHARQIIEEGCSLVSEGIRRCIRQGTPDWDAIFFAD